MCEMPVVENGEIKVGWPLCVKATISVDHRVSAGEIFRRAIEVVGVMYQMGPTFNIHPFWVQVL